MLINDPDTDKEAAAMDVRVGQTSDPSHLQGTAHFCEHMLFLGTGKRTVALIADTVAVRREVRLGGEATRTRKKERGWFGRGEAGAETGEKEEMEEAIKKEFARNSGEAVKRAVGGGGA